MKIVYLPTGKVQDDYLEPGHLHRTVICKNIQPFATSLDKIDREEIEREERVYNSIGKILTDYKLLDRNFTHEELHQIRGALYMVGSEDLMRKIEIMMGEEYQVKKVVAYTTEMLENNVKRLSDINSKLEKRISLLEDTLHNERWEHEQELDTYFEEEYNPILHYVNEFMELPLWLKPFKAIKALKDIYYHINPHMKKEN